MISIGQKVSIRPLRTLNEAKSSARMMLRSEPWLTLHFDYRTTLAALRDPNREAYLARVGDRLAGVIVLNLRGPLRGYIQAIGVWPEWRGRGIGQKLLAFAEGRIFRESPNVFLCVSSFNKDAKRLYQRLGYRKVGELKDYVVNGHSEFLMRKTVGPIAGFKVRA